MEEGNVYSAYPGGTRGNYESDIMTKKGRIAEFVKEFRVGNSYVYMDQLRQNCALNEYTLSVDLEDMISFDQEIAGSVFTNPDTMVDLFGKCATEIAIEKGYYISNLEGQGIEIDDIASFVRGDSLVEQHDSSKSKVAGFVIQVLLKNQRQNIVPLRQLKSSHLSKLVAVSGIIIATSRKRVKGTELSLRCRACGHRKKVRCREGFGGAEIPRSCEGGQDKPEKCPNDPYSIVAEDCTFIDQQIIKLQEDPETIPTGEVPRQVSLSVERTLVDRAAPGSRAIVLGTYSTRTTNMKKTVSPGSLIQEPYMRVVGLQVGSARANSFFGGNGDSIFSNYTGFTPKEEDAFEKLSQLPDLRERLINSVAPAICGHKDIKEALLCQLFSGSPKRLPDSMKLRGDLHVLLLGDPGVGKSQLLKFVSQVAPIGVYTSGKGSSAAGLTASVTKDKGREFYLEGGAMVLADGGIVCIDEFDKMRSRDRVAIHEAMEQQTISIAKAGITTVLNSRTSVLAAANPTFGRYDDLRTQEDNLESFQTTILSRFDLIFLVKDRLSREQDRRISGHVLNLHMRSDVQERSNISRQVDVFPQKEERSGPIVLGRDGCLSIDQLKQYITYCKCKCFPRLSDGATTLLQNEYVAMRASLRERGENSVVPITVRQLEAIIRVAESLAKMTLSPLAMEPHVSEAIRLFRTSTFEAATTNAPVAHSLSPQAQAEVQNAETLLKRRLPIGSGISEKILVDDFVKQGISEQAMKLAIQLMVVNHELEYSRQRKWLSRKA